jgi:hypothetical protein
VSLVRIPDGVLTLALGWTPDQVHRLVVSLVRLPNGVLTLALGWTPDQVHRLVVSRTTYWKQTQSIA